MNKQQQSPIIKKAEYHKNTQWVERDKSMKVISSSGESPFQQIGSRIKSIFGNFFKVEEKMNKSYEELNEFEGEQF